MERMTPMKMLETLGAKPSKSEERGLAILQPDDNLIFSPGISTAGFAEIRMVKDHPTRKVIATTIDRQGLDFAQDVISQVGLSDRIQTKFEDLREGEYPENTFDVIYARLVLHYLSQEDLENVLAQLYTSLKPNGRLFSVVRSEKNIPADPNRVSYDPTTHLTTLTHLSSDGNVTGKSTRYFHTPDSIATHLKDAGFSIQSNEEYPERLYKDFMRQDIAPQDDIVIETIATK